MGMRVTKPFLEVGIISPNGSQLLPKVDVKLNRCTFSHELGVTLRLIEYEHGEYARIGVMPPYGDANTIKWFNVEFSWIFHLLNCFEDGDEVVVWGCRAFASVIPGPRYGLANLYLEEPGMEEPIKVEYHKFEENVIFCTGATFVSKGKHLEEDDGWIITHVHNEDINTSQVYIIETKKLTSEPVTKITLSCRVPYGFHGAFMPTPLQIS